MGEPDIAVVGAGIVGLAVARELAQRDPQRRVVVLERESASATTRRATTRASRTPGSTTRPARSRRASASRAGASWRGYCEARGLAYERCGKLIVALDRGELPALDELERRGAANGVAGPAAPRRGGAARDRAARAGIAALHSPETAIVDFAAVARALADDLRAAGGEIVTGRGGRGHRAARRRRRAARGGSSCATRAASSPPASRCSAPARASDRLAVLAGAAPDPRIVPFRGAYLRLVPQRRDAGARADLPGARPAAAVPGRPPHAPHRRRRPDRPDRACSRRAGVRRTSSTRCAGRAPGGWRGAGGAPG